MGAKHWYDEEEEEDDDSWLENTVDASAEVEEEDETVLDPEFDEDDEDE